jgi:alpha-beta hydrolase superfamily lysophospholipase
LAGRDFRCRLAGGRGRRAAWPGLGLGVLAVWVGVGLIFGGVLRTVGWVSGAADQRVTAVISGLAGVVFGVLALSWPDVTILVVAVVFGARTVLTGLALVTGAFRRSPPGAAVPAAPAGRARRWSRTLRAGAALVVAVALLAVSAFLRQASPSPDAFYQPPAHVPSAPGALLRAEPFTTGIPADARAWRILYTTTRDAGVPAVATAIVLEAKDVPAGPRPVIAWAHGTTGIAEGCAPSLAKDPLGSGAMPALPQVIAKGWILVATDYTGLGTMGPTPYLIGQGEGRSVLDAVRAAQHMTQVDLGDQTVVWGHSQGGQAALWAGILAPSYAPDVNVIGVAAMAPASNLTALADNLGTITGGSIFAAYVIDAYAANYPDVSVSRYVKPAAQAIVRATAARCLAEPEVFISIGTALAAGEIFAVSPSSGPLGIRLAENIPTQKIRAPVLLAQGEADPLVIPAAQAAYVKTECGTGTTIDYRTYPGLDHLSLVAATSPLIPELISWTQDRFDGKPAASTC